MPLDLFATRNRLFLTSLENAWEPHEPPNPPIQAEIPKSIGRETISNENDTEFSEGSSLNFSDNSSFLEIPSELKNIQDFVKKIQRQHQQTFPWPRITPALKISGIKSLTFRERLRKFILKKQKIIANLLLYYVETIDIIEEEINELHDCLKIQDAKVHAEVKENGDIEIIIFSDLIMAPEKFNRFHLIDPLYQAMKAKWEEDRDFRIRKDCEESEERPFIELKIEDSRIIIRDYSFDSEIDRSNPFKLKGESSFRSQFLTEYLLSLMKDELLLPQKEGDFPQDIYPFMVKEFLRLTESELLKPKDSDNNNDNEDDDMKQILEMNRLLDLFLEFFQQEKNLFMVLYSAQEKLRGFGDFSSIYRDQNGNYQNNQNSSYAEACRRLVNALKSKSPPPFHDLLLSDFSMSSSTEGYL